jgi:inorganic phosphate transporter, PiT family
MMATVPLLLLTLLLAYSNGSNDVSKGIATLAGSGVSNFRAAVLWGGGWTVAGGLLAAFVSRGLVATFSGKGFLARPIDGPGFLGAVSIGAIAWVAISSKTGMPVSTTHAIAGSLAGAAVVAQGVSALHWGHLVENVFIPLAVSPFLSVALIYAIFPLLRNAVSRVEAYCLCVERRVTVAADGMLAMNSLGSTVVAPGQTCDSSPALAARVSAIDALHWFSSALTSFARGVNDTPKIVALGIAAAAFAHVPGPAFFAAAAAAMGAGSWLGGFRVTETLSRHVTPMSPTEGFAANAVTSALVGLASFVSLPVSTTHISSGAIIGVGLHREARSVGWRTVVDMTLAWVVTLPVAAIIAGGAYFLLR